MPFVDSKVTKTVSTGKVYGPGQPTEKIISCTGTGTKQIVCSFYFGSNRQKIGFIALESIHNEFFNGTGIEILPFSSETRAGKDELWNKIFDAIK